MATPSSKNPGATPTPFISSPHPSSVPMARPLSHKSPSIRTPSASGHGHGHHLSASSHQYPTPLAAATSVEDTAAFSSPSALLALGLGVITPSPAGNDGLVGQGIIDHDLNSMAMSGPGIGAARDNDEEKKRKVEEVIQLLRTRVTGRGVCREGVERLGILEGFACLWQEDNLSIAGNSVDLEIEFEPAGENVKDVSLKYATPGAQEGERRDEATAVLKRDLIQSPRDREQGIWKRLEGFHVNLQRLARMDQLSQDVNCFEAIEGLYDSLHRIWEGEKRRPSQDGNWNHVCKGLVGKPGLHKGRRIGLGLEYWFEQRRVLDSKLSMTQDAMDLDQPLEDGSREASEQLRTWSVTIECEVGYPPLRVSKDWVDSEVFTTVNAGNHSSAVLGDSSELTLVNWMDPPPTLVPSISNNNPDSMALESTILTSATPNRRFVAKLEPPVDIPVFAASEVYRLLGLDMPQDFKLNTYDGLLMPPSASSRGPEERFAEDEEKSPLQGRVCRRTVLAFDSDGSLMKNRHKYTFHSFEHVAGRTIRDLPFSHPRQLADILPILRQYALLSSLLRRIFPFSRSQAQLEVKPSKLRNVNQSSTKSSRMEPVNVISNVSPTVSKLKSLLANETGWHNGAHPVAETSGVSGSPYTLEEIVIDVSLRTPISSPPSILLLFNTTEEAAAITINVDIGANGQIHVSNISGPWDDNNNTNGSFIGHARAESQDLCDKLAKVLETCEDLGLLIEWVLRWMRQQKGLSSVYS